MPTGRMIERPGGAMPGGGHFMFFENPRRFHDEAAAFLSA